MGRILRKYFPDGSHSVHFCAPRFAELWREMTFAFIFAFNLLMTTVG